MIDQRSSWESFYSTNNRPWKGVADLKDVPFAEGSHILEIGCGNGKTAMALTDMGYRVTGVDFSESAIDMCRKIVKGNTKFLCADVQKMPFDDGKFDGAVIFHVLEHLTEEQQGTAVKEIERVLKNDSPIMIKAFSKGDMRSDKGIRIDDSTVIRGNGIMYHYFTKDELCQLFSGCICESISTINETTRFGETRSRIQAVFRTHV